MHIWECKNTFQICPNFEVYKQFKVGSTLDFEAIYREQAPGTNTGMS